MSPDKRIGVFWFVATNSLKAGIPILRTTPATSKVVISSIRVNPLWFPFFMTRYTACLMSVQVEGLFMGQIECITVIFVNSVTVLCQVKNRVFFNFLMRQLQQIASVHI
jgi:hypothetical protein